MAMIVYIIIGVVAAAILYFLFKLFLAGLAVWGMYKAVKYVEREARDIPDETKIIHAEIREGNVVRPVAKFAWRRLWRFWDVK